MKSLQESIFDNDLTQLPPTTTLTVGELSNMCAKEYKKYKNEFRNIDVDIYESFTSVITKFHFCSQNKKYDYICNGEFVCHSSDGDVWIEGIRLNLTILNPTPGSRILAFDRRVGETLQLKNDKITAKDLKSIISRIESYFEGIMLMKNGIESWIDNNIIEYKTLTRSYMTELTTQMYKSIINNWFKIK